MTTQQISGTDVETSDLDELDFAYRPRCEASLMARIFRGFHIIVHRCRRRAAWVAVVPCCSTVSYSCEKHYQARILDNFCVFCNRSFTHEEMKWTKL